MPLLLVCIMLSLALCETTPARGGAGEWNAPFKVSDTVRFSWFPDITAGPDNSVHITWSSSDSDPVDPKSAIDLLRYRTMRDGVWSGSNDIVYAGVGGYTVRNNVVYGRDGRLYVLLRMGVRLYLTSAPANDALSSKSWSTPVAVSDSGAYYTALALDSTNRLHMLYSAAVLTEEQIAAPCKACSDLYYRSSADGGQTWSPVLNMSNSIDGENRPQIVVDSADRLHAVWDLGVDWYAGAGVAKAGVYRRSDDGGITWSEPYYFTAAGQPVQQTSVAVNTQGQVMAVFRGATNDRIYYQFSPDGGVSWQTPGELPGVIARNINDNNLDTYALAADSSNRFHLLVSGFGNGQQDRGQSPSLLHLTWDGAQWTTTRLVMSNELYPEWPRLVSQNGNQLHAVWFTRHASDLFSSDQNANYEVWYSQITVDSPAITPPPLFTPVPTVAPTEQPAPTVLPTATPLPVAVAEAPLVAGPPAWEQQGLASIAIALVPALLLIVSVIGITIMVRRR